MKAIRFTVILIMLMGLTTESWAQKPVLINVSGTDTVIHQIGTAFYDSMYVDVQSGTCNGCVISRIGNVNINFAGMYVVSYTAKGSANIQSDTLQIVFKVTNLIPPILHLYSGDTIEIEVLSHYIEPGYFALSAYSGDTLTSSVTFTSTVIMDSLGTYSILYSVTDAFGLTTNKTRYVIVSDRTPPMVNVHFNLGKSFPVGTLFYEMNIKLTATDNYHDIEDVSVMIDTSQLNPNVVGKYFIYFSAKDTSNNVSTTQYFEIDIVPQTGLENIDQSKDISVFPNPSNKTVFIQSADKVISVKVYDSNGRLIQHNQSVEKVKFEYSGTFIIEIETEKSTFRKKILVDLSN